MFGTPELIHAYHHAHPLLHIVYIDCPNHGKVEADPVDVEFNMHPSCRECGEFATEILAVIERNAA